MLNIIIASIGCLIDLKLKENAESEQFQQGKEYLQGFITTSRAYNNGAFLGILKNNPKLLKAINLSAMVLLGIYNIYLLFMPKQTGEKIAVGLLTAGAMSNTYDRQFKGKVTDYFMIKHIPNVVFNLGDIFIFCGGITALIASLFTKK